MLIIPAGEAFHFDSRAIGRQPADKPITNGANERIALYFFTYSTWSGRRSLYVEDLFVRAQFRGKGIGKALFQRMAEVASEQHCQGMRWEVLSWNSPAVEFYRSVGAEILREWWPVRLIGDAFKELGEGLRPRE